MQTKMEKLTIVLPFYMLLFHIFYASKVVPFRLNHKIENSQRQIFGKSVLVFWQGSGFERLGNPAEQSSRIEGIT